MMVRLVGTPRIPISLLTSDQNQRLSHKGVAVAGRPTFLLVVAVLGIYLSLLCGCETPANTSRVKAG
jgi:hypothetical protein